MKNKLVIVARRDLKLSAGKMAVQVAHAAVSCALSAMKARGAAQRVFDEWYREGQKKVVVRVSSERDLRELNTLAKAQGLTTALISDAGLTQIPPGTVTCLGIGPAPSDAVDAITGDLSLY